MKKILAILCSAALALTLCNGVFADENLALDGTAIGDSVHVQYGGDAINLNDGDLATRWQSNAKGTEADPGWGGVEWDAAKTFNKIVIEWETAHPAKDGFKIQVSNDGTTWTDVTATAVRTGTAGTDDADNLSKDHQIDTITFAAQTAKAVRVYCFVPYQTSGGDVKENPSIYEFQVYNDATIGGGAGDDSQGGADTGVASTLAFAVVAMAAGAVALKSKKNAD